MKNNVSVVFHESLGDKFSGLEIPCDVNIIYIVIGPEGGITDSEIEVFKSSGAIISRLGEPILRSAHAGFAALSALQTKIGRW